MSPIEPQGKPASSTMIEADRAQLARISDDAIAAGHVVVTFDLTACHDKATLLQVAAAAFHFPDWFGHNWDALSDSLGDLSWLDAPGYLVVLAGADGFEQRCPQLWRVLSEILAETAVQRRADGVAWHNLRLRGANG